MIFEQAGEPLACTSIYSHPFELDLIAPLVVRKASALLRGIPGALLSTRVLFCGLPISLGKSHFWVERRRAAEILPKVWQQLDGLMREIGEEENIHLLGAKEFDRRGVSSLVAKEAAISGHALCHSLHTVTLPIVWKTFEEYLGALRANYRRQILSDLRDSEKSGIEWTISRVDAVNPDDLYDLYANVFARAENRLEQLTPAFFEEFGKAYGEKAKVVLGLQGGRAVAMALLYVDQAATIFMFAGMDYRLVVPFGMYRNLLIQVIQAAIRAGSRSLELGQTSYDIKQRLGGTPRPLVFYLKDTNPIYHLLLKQVSPLLFPEVSHERRHVFRHDSGGRGGKSRGVAALQSAAVRTLLRRSSLDSAA